MTPNPLHETPPSPSGGALLLTDWGVIRAEGPDAKAVLHGQLTQDILQLAPQGHALAGYCSPKGRLLGSFVVWQAADHDLRLACSADILPAVLKRLQMFVLRARCKLSDVSATTALWGLAGPQAQGWLGERAPVSPATVWRGSGERAAEQVIHLPDVHGQRRWLRAADRADAAPAVASMSASDWGWLEVASGVVRIVAATVDQFVPQMSNLELVGGVSFQKGCYPGQEVVARSQYRGTLKRRLFHVASPVALAPGGEVFHSADPDQPAGLVANAASRTLADGTPQHSALVVMKVSAAQGGTLHAQSAQGPVLQLGLLPYAVPLEAVVDAP